MFSTRRIIRLFWSVYPTWHIWIIRPHWNFLFLVPLVQLVAAVIWTSRLCFFTATWYLCGGLDASSRRCIERLVSTLHWTSHLDGALDISSRWCIGHTSSKGPKKSYKYDLANSLVSLIALSLDHQNHSEWPKCGHVRYTLLKICGHRSYLCRMPSTL